MRSDKWWCDPPKSPYVLWIGYANKSYLMTNVELSTATEEWVVKTYSQRNWVEVFYREAKGWLGLKEYQGAR